MKIGSIVIHCFEFDKMVGFWGKALNYHPSTLYQLNLYKEFLVWYPQERGDIAWKESK